jgi:hypothetical protein
MVDNYGKPIDLHSNELRNAVVQNLGSAPAGELAGQLWYDTLNHLLKWFNGTIDIDPLNRTNHSGSQIAATISDFTAAVQALRWASMTAPNAAVPMGAQNFSGLATASGAGQAVEYAQFNTALANIATGMDLKETQAQVVTTTNLSLAAPGATINGHTMVANDRILAAGQTTASANGLYVWNGAASAATRAPDANTAGSILPGTMVAVGSTDSANPDTVWMQTASGTGTNNAIVLGTDSQTWIRVLSPVTYTAGNGISITAGVIAAVVAGAGGLAVGGGGLSLDTTIATRKYTTTLTGDGVTTSWTVTHNLGTTDPVVVVRIAGAKWETDDQVAGAGASTTQVVIGISPAPANATAILVAVYG